MLIEYPIPVVPLSDIRAIRDVTIRHAVLRDCSDGDLEGCYIPKTHVSDEVDPELRSIEGEACKVKVLGIVYPTETAIVVSNPPAVIAGDGQIYIDWRTII